MSAPHRGKEVEIDPKPVIGSLETAGQYGSVALVPGTFFSDGFSLVEQKTPLSSHSLQPLLVSLCPGNSALGY